MSIIEKRIKITLENGTLPDIERIENTIKQAGLEPVRWAIVDITKTECIILANGVQKQGVGTL